MNRNRRLLRLLTHFIDSGGRYLLYDDFSVNRAAGTIDNTLTDPDGEATRSTGATGSIAFRHLAQPDSFDMDLPFDVVYSNGIYSISGFDFDDYLDIPTGDTVYVSTTGSDSNDGSEGSPFGTVYKALTEGSGKIYVAPGTYYRNRTSGGGTMAGAVTNDTLISAWPGMPGRVYLTTAEWVAWTNDLTYTNTWTCTRSATSMVVDVSVLDAEGNPSKLIVAISETNCDETAGSYYIDGSTVYVRTYDDREPDGDILVVVNSVNVKMLGDYALVMDSIHVIGGNTQIANTASGQSTAFYAKNCVFSHNPTSNGLTLQGIASVLESCEIYETWLDGYNYHALNSTEPYAIEINCLSYGNGLLDPGNANNGSTAHEDSRIFRIGGRYYNSNGPVVADVNTSKSWMVDCSVYDSARVITPIGVYLADGWLDGCTVSGNEYDLYATSEISHFDTRFDTEFGTVSEITEREILYDSGVYVLSGAADDSLWYDETVTRAAGQCVVFTPTITDATTTIEFGFDTDQAGALAANAIRMASDLLKPYDGGTAGPQIYVPADATEYSLAVCLLSAGAAYFLDGNLLYRGGTDATATLYAGISNTDASGTVDGVRAPQDLWAPTPIAADTGTSADVAGTYYTDGGTLTGIEAGGDGETWNGPTWSNGVDGAKNTPGLGAELIIDGSFESWDTPNYLSDWVETTSGTSVLSQSSDAYSGSYAVEFSLGPENSTISVYQNAPGADGDWVKASMMAKADATQAIGIKFSGPYFSERSFDLTTSWSACEAVGRKGTSSGSAFQVSRNLSANRTITFDDVSIKVIPTADLFRSISDADTPYVYASASWIIESGTQAGVVVCLDDADTPANFIIAYHDGTSVITEKCLAGTYTTLGTVTATYDADEPLVVRTLPDGNDMSVWVWYDGAYIANYTLDETTDAAIIASTLHGLFSTHADNEATNVVIYEATGHSIPGA